MRVLVLNLYPPYSWFIQESKGMGGGNFPLPKIFLVGLRIKLIQDGLTGDKTQGFMCTEAQ